MKVARVFPRTTSATPTDELAFIGPPGLFVPDDIDEVHVSCTFTWDIPIAKRLVSAWEHIAPVKLGGPAIGTKSEEFTPGMYLKKGITITSRGCDNNCWFCVVPKRDGPLKEYEVKQGNLIFDDNFLSCSDAHIKEVFNMLYKQRNVAFPGGIEARKLKQWHVEEFARVKTQQLFCAYDTPQDLPPLIEAAKMFKQAEKWYRWRKCCCYVLIGDPSDTIEKAEQRLITVLKLGYCPFATFYRNEDDSNLKTKQWAELQRKWTRPAIIHGIRKSLLGE